jgi:hypothetical protein
MNKRLSYRKTVGCILEVLHFKIQILFRDTFLLVRNLRFNLSALRQE